VGFRPAPKIDTLSVACGEWVGRLNLGLAALARPAIFCLMADIHPAEELALLRDFFAQLEDRRLRLERGGTNVTKAEIAILRREIAFLERPNSPAPPLGLIVLMALANDFLNSFFFYPAILAVGALLPRLKDCKPALAAQTCSAA
jgi:hypothetical protein